MILIESNPSLLTSSQPSFLHDTQILKFYKRQDGSLTPIVISSSSSNNQPKVLQDLTNIKDSDKDDECSEFEVLITKLTQQAANLTKKTVVMQDNCAQSIASFKSFMDNKNGGVTKEVVTPKSMIVKKEKSVGMPIKGEQNVK